MEMKLCVRTRTETVRSPTTLPPPSPGGTKRPVFSLSAAGHSCRAEPRLKPRDRTDLCARARGLPARLSRRRRRRRCCCTACLRVCVRVSLKLLQYDGKNVLPSVYRHITSRLRGIWLGTADCLCCSLPLLLSVCLRGKTESCWIILGKSQQAELDLTYRLICSSLART